LFEELSLFSAKKYLGGDALIFGTSSRETKKPNKRFVESINRLARSLGEGGSFRQQNTFSAKDSKLDIVAWRGFPDGRPSQIVMFGQCAGGANWKSKLNELNPDSFWDIWMAESKVSVPLRSVFMPHRLFDDEEWKRHAREARLLFDRCRIAAYAHEDTATGIFATRLLRCCKAEWKINI
jgi:hypothetical protein